MYAVIATGGKQYKVQQGDILYIEKLNADNESIYTFENVLALHDEKKLKIGAPYVKGATVTAKVLKTDKAKKITVMKHKAKKNYKRTQGHRQPYTKVQIESISASGANATEAAE